MPHPTVRTSLALGLILSACCASAADVTELKPEQLAAFLAAHPLAVVQLTSPDPKCGYCVGTAKTFDDAAAQARNPALKFARVQWAVWKEHPDLMPLVATSGIPRQVVFRNGKEMRSAGGRPASARGLLDDIDMVLRLPPAPGVFYYKSVNPPAAAAAPAPARYTPNTPNTPNTPTTPVTPAHQDATRLMIRRDFLNAVASACGKKYPAQASHYREVAATWAAARKDKLNQAAMLMVGPGSPDGKALEALVDKERQTIQAWQVGKLGVPLDRAPLLTDCDKIMGSLDTLP